MKLWDEITIATDGAASWLTTPVFWVLRALKINANSATMVRLFICVAFVIPCYAQGTYWWCMAGLAFAVASASLDFVDGRLAREFGQAGAFGGWLDGRVDVLSQSIILAAVCFGCDSPAVVVALLSQAVLVHFTDMYGGVFQRAHEFMAEARPVGAAETICDRLLLIHGPIVWIGTHRWPLIAATFLGRMDIYLWTIGVFQLVRAAALWYTMMRVVRGPWTPYFRTLAKFVVSGYDYKLQA